MVLIIRTVVSALNMYETAVPARMSVAGEEPFLWAMTMMNAIGISAKMNALRITPMLSNWDEMLTDTPRMTATATPKHAPDEIPVV